MLITDAMASSVIIKKTPLKMADNQILTMLSFFANEMLLVMQPGESNGDALSAKSDCLCFVTAGPIESSAASSVAWQFRSHFLYTLECRSWLAQLLNSLVVAKKLQILQIAL